MVGLRQRQAGSAGAQRCEHHRRAVRALELPDHFGAARGGDATVQERHRAGGTPLQHRQDEVTERPVLREQQYLLVVSQDLGEHLVERGELAGPVPAAPQQRRAVAQIVGRVIADLLERGQPREDRTLARGPFGLLDLLHHVPDDRPVEGRLFAGQWGVDTDVLLVGQVGDDPRVGFEPTQHERAGERPQPRCRRLVAMGFDRDREPGPERTGRTEHPGIGELQDRAQLVEAVLDRRAGERDPMIGRDGHERPRHRRGRVLDRLRLVRHEPSPRHRCQ